MKKYLFLMIALVGLVGMSGCSKDDDPAPFNPNRTFVFDLPSDSWEPTADGRGWQTDLDFPEITSDVFEYDNVDVHIMFTDEIYHPLTTVYEGITYRYDYAVGSILLEARYLDGSQIRQRPPTRYGKVIISESWE
ncbi:hypothetical protein [Olivibacter jilunii]|uniref:hypothetical protein n=1 Tax=Olivibacter jilunii TaxID=985016 RepID=UPI003F15CE47